MGIIMVANKDAFVQIPRRRFLNEWEAFKKVISRRNIRRRITIPLTLSNLKLLRRIKRTENILHRNFTRRQVAIQNRVASNIGISQSTFSVKVLNLFSRSRRKTNKRKSKHSAMLRNKETRHRMFIVFFFQAEDGIRDLTVTGVQTCALPISLESRLDNLVYRMGFAVSRRQARQLVRHRHVQVNGRTLDVPSYRVGTGDEVKIADARSEEHTSELQSQSNLVCRLLLEKKKKTT